jgi:hypothetical protein
MSWERERGEGERKKEVWEVMSPNWTTHFKKAEYNTF